jgi:hypothetical protein
MRDQKQSGTLPVVAGLVLLGGVIWTGLAIARFAGMLPPLPAQGQGTISLLAVMSPLGIVLGPLAAAAGLGMWQRQRWGRNLFMGVGYFALIVTACRTFSYLNPQSTATVPTKIVVTVLAALLLFSVSWTQTNNREFH